MYFCIPCYCDACLKSSALRVGVKTFHNTILFVEYNKRNFLGFWKNFMSLFNFYGLVWLTN